MAMGPMHKASRVRLEPAGLIAITKVMLELTWEMKARPVVEFVVQGDFAL